MSRLFLCEKPSQGRDIAAVLGATQKSPGCLKGPQCVVTWCFGHLLEQASPEQYGEQYGKPWRLEVLPVLPEEWQVVVKSEAKKQLAVIRQLLKAADSVVIATDADREGEVIAREILEHCRYRGKIERLWLSALDETSVRTALAALRPGEATEREYLAGLARARADWTIGMNLTRLYSIKAQENGYRGVLSVGRVQTPTLNLVVQRDKAIASFIPAPFWNVLIALKAQNVAFQAQWVPAPDYCDDEKRCVQQDVARQVAQLCQQNGNARVIRLETKRETSSAPLPFDLGTLQQQCSKRWGFSAGQVLEIAQSLYETHKLTTYPRTDCGYLPQSMREEVPEVLSALARMEPGLQTTLNALDRQFVSRVWNDKKVTAHHAIIPTKKAGDLSLLNEAELKVYQLIRAHYLAQFLPLHEVDVTQVELNCGGQKFKANGKVLMVSGWKALLGAEPEAGDNGALPALEAEGVYPLAGVEVKTQHTRPPEHYTDGTLIAAMKNASQFVTDPRLKQVLRDNAGLGTEATRAGIIDTLKKRGFLESKGRHLHATAVARDFVAALPEPLKDPALTALWEQSLDDIAGGSLTLEVFMSRLFRWTTELVAAGQRQAIAVSAAKAATVADRRKVLVKK